MWCPFPNRARLAVSAVVLLSIIPNVATADDCGCRKSRARHLFHDWPTYQREADYGLLRYPNATYWLSADRREGWDSGDAAGTGSMQVAPSPWAYSTIAPFSYQYRSSYGSSYGGAESPDCRN